MQVLESMRDSMRDQNLASQLLARADRAMYEKDYPAMRTALQQLIGLLPPEKRGRLPGYGGTTLG